MLVYILASWIPESRNALWYRYILKLVDPYLALFRKFIPRIGFIDISPLIALLCLEAVPFIVIRALRFIVIHIFHASWLLQYI
ncbi:YGGT family protein [Chlamydia avium 10DC88]|uniref:YGGT family protein n=1 Tax=Chlamydia avium 10DC88 TaxID=1229831 RepID=W8JGG5_9CHLA|nr:YGGT family protein [Chlamydia avium 10DC88]